MAGFYQYLGNYHSFGSKKFIPEMSQKQFETILKEHPLYKEQSAKGKQYKSVIDELYPQINQILFNIKKPYKQLGFPSEGGVTAYFGKNLDRADLQLVQ